MKIRNGFVSNSSSSSFCIYGTKITKEQFDLTSKERIKELGLEEHYYSSSGYYDDDVYIGISWKYISDNETGASFKLRITNALKKLYGDDIETRTIEMAWYDG